MKGSKQHEEWLLENNQTPIQRMEESGMTQYKLPDPPVSLQVKDGYGLTWTADPNTDAPYLWRREQCPKCYTQVPGVRTWAELLATGAMRDVP